jgi:hypothetical protein
LDIHPFISEIDLCDYLLKYAWKILKKNEFEPGLKAAVTESNKQDNEEDRKNVIDEQVKKGRLIAAVERDDDSKFYSNLQQNKNQKKKKQDKPSKASEEVDDQQLNLDIVMIKKFGRLNIAAPTKKADLERIDLELSELRQAFIEKGDEERQYAKDQFLRSNRKGNQYQGET